MQIKFPLSQLRHYNQAGLQEMQSMFLLDKPQQKGDFANIPKEVGNCSVLMGYAL